MPFALRRDPAVSPRHLSAAALAVVALPAFAPCKLVGGLSVTPLLLPAPSAACHAPRPDVSPRHRSAARCARCPCLLSARGPPSATPLLLPAPSALHLAPRSCRASRASVGRRARRCCARLPCPLLAPCAIACDTTAAACSECPSTYAAVPLCFPDIGRPPRSPRLCSLFSSPVSSVRCCL